MFKSIKEFFLGKSKVSETHPLDFTERTAAPYKVETPIKETFTVVPALDPIAVAIDLEPVQVSQPAKKTRKPRTPKAEKVVKEKAPAKPRAPKKATAKKSKKAE